MPTFWGVGVGASDELGELKTVKGFPVATSAPDPLLVHTAQTGEPWQVSKTTACLDNFSTFSRWERFKIAAVVGSWSGRTPFGSLPHTRAGQVEKNSIAARVLTRSPKKIILPKQKQKPLREETQNRRETT